jgi:hypothetical protein
MTNWWRRFFPTCAGLEDGLLARTHTDVEQHWTPCAFTPGGACDREAIRRHPGPWIVGDVAYTPHVGLLAKVPCVLVAPGGEPELARWVPAAEVVTL